MIKKLLATCLILLLIGGTKNAFADHCVGADISFENVGVDSFQVTVAFYRDCQGIAAPTDAYIDIQSSSCSYFGGADLPEVGSPQDITPICLADINQDKCNAGVAGKYPGVQQTLYTGLVVLPFQCTDWVFSYETCCRNAALTNVFNPTSWGIYVQATLNNVLAPTDHSPLFSNLPVPFFCVMVPANYNHGAYDPDNDSLVYSAITPFSGAGAPITYNSGFSASYPLSTSPANTFSFSTSTGQMSFTPAAQQVTSIAVEVDEYRNKVMIGSVMRDIQIYIEACNTVPPSVLGGIINATGGSSVYNSYVVTTCPGANLNFQMVGSDSDSTLNLYYTSNVGTVIPAVNYYTDGDNPDTTFFSWTPTLADTGKHFFTATLQNDACPIYSTQVFSFTIDVATGVKAGPTLSVCGGAPAQLSAKGGGSYTWTPNIGLSSDTISDPIATPTITTTYTVTSDLPGGCVNSDTEVVVVGAIGLNPGVDLTLCKGQTTQLNAGAGDTYSWSPTTGLSCSSCANPVASPTTSTTYTVTVSDSSGCTGISSDTIVIVNPPNVPTISTSGDTLTSSGKTNNQWYRNDTLLVGATDSTYIAAVNGYYKVVITNPANGCSSISDSVYVNITGIQQVAALRSNVQIFPNPFNDIVNLVISPSASDIKDWNMKITDELGRTVYERSYLNYNNEIDLSKLPCGVYFINIITKTTKAEFSVIRQN